MRKTLAKIISIIAISVIMLAGNSALAYTGDGYTIDIPSTYTSGGSNTWASTASKATVNIQILANSSGETVSQSSLQETMDSLKSAYSGITIEKSEITKLNGMDAMHFVSNVSGMYIEQYAVATSSKIYVLTIGAYEKSYLSSSEATSIVSSFNVTGATSSSSSYSNSNNNTVNNTSNNTINTSNTSNTSSYNNSISNSLDNKSANNSVDDDKDDEDDDEDEKSSKKSKSSKSDEDEEESNTWVVVAIVAGVIVFALIAIIIIVAIVVSGKKKQQY